MFLVNRGTIGMNQIEENFSFEGHGLGRYQKSTFREYGHIAYQI